MRPLRRIKRRLILKLIRHGLTTVGGVLIAHGILEPGSADDLASILTSEEAIGALTAMGGLAMSLWELREQD